MVTAARPSYRSSDTRLQPSARQLRRTAKVGQACYVDRAAAPYCKSSYTPLLQQARRHLAESSRPRCGDGACSIGASSAAAASVQPARRAWLPPAVGCPQSSYSHRAAAPCPRRHCGSHAPRAGLVSHAPRAMHAAQAMPPEAPRNEASALYLRTLTMFLCVETRAEKSEQQMKTPSCAKLNSQS